eukprot:4747734-Karenia_brevis.AAC.1
MVSFRRPLIMYSGGSEEVVPEPPVDQSGFRRSRSKKANREYEHGSVQISCCKSFNSPLLCPPKRQLDCL